MYYFIIDTDSYSGNFEREMCAFITGALGECEVGEENAKRFAIDVAEEYKHRMDAIIDQEQDEHGCWRPVKIYFTKGCNAYQSVCIIFSEEPTESDIAFLKERAYKYDGLTRFSKEESPKITGFRLLKKETTIKELWSE